MAWLDWEENVFVGLKAVYGRVFVRPKERAAAATRVTLAEVRGPLFLLAHLLSGRKVEFIETANRVLCDDLHIFLPPTLARAPTRAGNVELYQLKTIVAALALRHGGPFTAHRPLPELLQSEILALPGLAARLQAAQLAGAGADLWDFFGRPLPSTSREPASRDLHQTPAAADAAEEVTEVEGQGQTQVAVVAGDDDQPSQAEMPMHTFEKVETLEEYSGLDRKTDGDDELEEHAEALRALDMRQVTRSRERPRSIYRSDLVLDGLALESRGTGDGEGIAYPEWDHRRRHHRPRWCFVRESHHDSADVAWVAETQRRHRALVLDLKKKIAALANLSLQQKRQPFGPEFDLDAVVDGEVARRAGQNPSELCYVDRRRSLHDVAAVILLDLSFSTDAWIDDSRVLDTIRETIFCVGEGLQDFVERWAIATFSSNTRWQCDYGRIKDFDESWATTRGRLGCLAAQGYTRIGPALRHAQEQLRGESARRKLVILVTDGRPCDYDRYEGTYGIEDVKKAIETGKQHGIRTHAFAIDRRARENFPRMFTRHDYHIVPRPQALVQSLSELFLRLQLGA